MGSRHDRYTVRLLRSDRVNQSIPHCYRDELEAKVSSRRSHNVGVPHTISSAAVGDIGNPFPTRHLSDMRLHPHVRGLQTDLAVSLIEQGIERSAQLATNAVCAASSLRISRIWIMTGRRKRLVWTRSTSLASYISIRTLTPRVASPHQILDTMPQDRTTQPLHVKRLQPDVSCLLYPLSMRPPRNPLQHDQGRGTR